MKRLDRRLTIKVTFCQENLGVRQMEKMHKYKNKILAIAITLLLTLSMAAALTVPNAHAAQYPGTTIPTWAYLQAVPTQIGLGQSVLLVMWIDKPPPTASGVLGDRWDGMALKITLPDGTTTTLGPFQSDDASGYSTHMCQPKSVIIPQSLSSQAKH